MERASFDVRLHALKSKIEPLERFIVAFAESLPQPLLYHSGQEHYGYRYGKPDVRHFCLLKAARVVSALNATIALAYGGFAQEIAVLIRTLVEYTTHIEFVLDGLDAGELAPGAAKYIEEYFSDFARNSSEDFKRAQVKQKTVNQRLGNRLDQISQESRPGILRKPAEHLYSNVYLTYSNYVHAKYPEVMDMYGGVPGRFHLDGMRDTSKDEEDIQIIDCFIDTASISLMFIVSRLKLHHLVRSDPFLTEWFRP